MENKQHTNDANDKVNPNSIKRSEGTKKPQSFIAMAEQLQGTKNKDCTMRNSITERTSIPLQAG